MYFADVLLERIEKNGYSLMTLFDLHSLVWQIYKDMSLDAIKVQNRPRSFHLNLTKRSIRQLERKRRIISDPDFGGQVWQILQGPALASAEEAICATDPFAYVAFLSAFERYGLTNRSPKFLQIASYSSPAWAKKRQEIEDPEELKQLKLKPTRPHPKEVVRRRPVETYLSKELGSSRRIRGAPIRISTIGRTFLDSLERPNLCGGMAHVVEIWAERAANYEDEIEKEVDEFASPINKVRAGYLLEKYVNSGSPILQKWQAFAQRGGSRKLDPEAPYEPTFSEKWMLSLNV